MSEETERDYLLGQIHQLEHENKELESEKAALEEEVKRYQNLAETAKKLYDENEQIKTLEAMVDVYQDQQKECDDLEEQNAKYRALVDSVDNLVQRFCDKYEPHIIGDDEIVSKGVISLLNSLKSELKLAQQALKTNGDD